MRHSHLSAASLCLLLSALAGPAEAAQTVIYYVDGNGTLKTAIGCSNGSSTCTGSTLLDINGNPIGTGNPLPVSDVLGPGSAIIGKVDIDQTTPGITNGVAIKDSVGTAVSATQDGSLRVSPTATKVFYDAFGTGFDTTANWAMPISAGGGAGEAWVPGSISLGTGTTPGGYASVQSQPSFQPVPPGFNIYQFAITLPAVTPANTEAFWGFGTAPATPTAANPITEGCGFELQLGGKMAAVCFAAGARSVIQDLSAATGNGAQPADGAVHSYYIFFRDDYYWFCIDSLTNVVAAQLHGTNALNIHVQPIKIQAVAGPSAPSGSLSLTIASVWVGDTGRNAGMIADGAHPWRRASVSALGGLSVTPLANSGAGAYSAVTIGTSAATILAANAAKEFVQIVNASPSATICINIGGTAAFAGAGCAAGSIPITPFGSWTREGNFIPSDAISAIASAGSTPATLGAF